MALGVSGKKVGSAYVELGVLDRDLKKGYAEAEAGAHRTGRAMKAGLALGAVAAAGGVYALVKGLKSSVDAARESEVSNVRMRTQLKALGISYDAHAKQIDRVIQKQSRLAALDDEDLQDSFTALVRTTHNVGDALRLNGLAADIARAKGIDLAAATSIVIKANMGNVGALKRQGIEIAKVTTAQDALKASHKKVTDAQMDAARAADAAATKQAAIAKLQSTFAGSAEAYGRSAAGAQERISVAVENLQETIGARLLPVLATVLVRLSKFVEWLTTSKGVSDALSRAMELATAGFRVLRGAIDTVIASIRTSIGFYERHKALVQTIAAVVAGMTAAFVAYRTVLAVVSTATKVYTALQIALNAVLTANPVGLIVVALGGLAAALVIAYKRSETFRNIVREAMGVVLTIFKTHVGIILTLVDKFLGGIQGVAEAASHLPFVGDKFKGVAEKIGGARDRVRELKGSIDRLGDKTVNVKVNLRYSANAGVVRPGDGVVGATMSAAAAMQPPSFAFGGGLQPPAGNPGGLKSFILDELGMAQRFGLGLTSGYRPGAITSTGNPSLHGVGQAIDVAGPSGNMAAFAQAVAGRPGIAEVIYTPVGAWYPGVGWTRPTGKIAADHYSHVHVGARGDGIATSRGWIGDGKVAAKPKPSPAAAALAARSEALNKKTAPARAKAVAAEQAKKAAAVNKTAAASVAAADKKIAAAERDANYGDRKWTLAAKKSPTPEGAALAQRLAVQAKITAANRNVSAIRSKISAYRAAAARARAQGLPGLARQYDAKAAEASLDLRDALLTVQELLNDRDSITADTGSTGPDPGDAGGGGDFGGDFDGGGGGGFDGGGGFEGAASSGPSAAEVEAQIQERIRAESSAVLGARSRFLSEFGSNIFSPGPGGLQMGGTELRNVTVKQYFTQQPTDPYVWLRKSEFAARGAF